ncbi:dihydrofolate reductase [Polynucleobacter kasalickyi]|uniref:Dihydrofolate reductase n=1 Tax=Polynucleobacter kasalickyi TaxID=1938817 RepID=A0A1W1YBU0_9BURK|nr:dihydrofolate reductase [Polynucleobacter kasalickyi]SMC33642.1 dihydrofolate reductase [Polynucleobacter kasalickyi]
MTISIIVARSKSGVIGINNQLPWHLPADLKHFKAITSGHPILMGRKTWDSLGRPLPNRRNIVISRQTGLDLAGAECFSSLEAAIAACQDAPEVFIIGGAQIYEQALSLVDQLIITEVDIEVDGDAFFPSLDNSWHIVAKEDHPQEHHLAQPDQAGKTYPAYSFITYQRVPGDSPRN